jgi:hypothetical protein
MDYQEIFNTLDEAGKKQFSILNEAGKKEFLERRRAPPPPPPGNMPYVNPLFADKESFKAKDASLRSNPKSPFTLMKPLRPNILDAAANERRKELAEQRKKTGLKWVVVT